MFGSLKTRAWSVSVLLLGAGLAVGGPAAAASWIVDAESNCGTSNTFSRPNERIRWYGECDAGKLTGQGVLIWYNGDVEIERNEGRFRNGEFDGTVVTTYPDGKSIFGDYQDGVRNGRFVIVQADGSHSELFFATGVEQSRRALSELEAREWRAGVKEPWIRNILAAIIPVGGVGGASAVISAPVIQPPAQPAAVAPAFAVEQPVAVARQARTSPGGQTARLYVEGGQLKVYEPAAGQQVASFQPANLAVPVNQYGALPSSTNAQLDPNDQYYPNKDGILVKVQEAPAPAPVNVYPASRPALPAPAVPEVRVITSAVNDVPAQPVVPQPAPQQSLPSPPAAAGHQTADALFEKAFRYERAGQFYDAEQTYTQILMQYPSAPSAMLANARLDQLTERTKASSVRIEPQATAQSYQAPSPPTRVVAVNAPRPSRDQRAESGYGISAPRLAYNSPALNRPVCTRSGLYEDGAKWCGIVVEDQLNFYRIKVSNVTLPSFGMVGLDRSTCTGNTFLNWFSRGASVKVPKTCMEFAQ